MASFTPPANATENPPTLPGSTPLQKSLFRHFRARPAGINVYILNDDTVTEDDPDGTAVVWVIGDRNGEAISAKYVKRAFYGGATYTDVTDAESTLLVAAGYSVG